MNLPAPASVLSARGQPVRRPFFGFSGLPVLAAGALLAALSAVSGCASAPPAATDTKIDKVSQAVTAPLHDLNVVRADIPAVLQQARRGPYAPPAASGCAALATAVTELDAVLGADLDQPARAGQPSLLVRGRDAAGDAAIDAVRNTAQGIIPFRGWVRKLTGAERYDREVEAAIVAGGVRRAFLKGLGQAAGCGTPAAPRPADASGPAP